MPVGGDARVLQFNRGQIYKLGGFAWQPDITLGSADSCLTLIGDQPGKVRQGCSATNNIAPEAITSSAHTLASSTVQPIPVSLTNPLLNNSRQQDNSQQVAETGDKGVRN